MGTGLGTGISQVKYENPNGWKKVGKQLVSLEHRFWFKLGLVEEGPMLGCTEEIPQVKY